MAKAEMHYAKTRQVILVLLLSAGLSATIKPALADSFDDAFFGALILKSKKQYDQALPLFQKAEKLRPKDPEPWAYEAQTNIKVRKYKEAEISARKALALDKNYEQAAQYLGTSLLALGKFKEAKVQIDRCLTLNPENDWARRYILIVEQKLQLPPTNVYEGRLTEDRAIMAALAKQIQDQRYEDSISLVNKHIARNPKDPSAYLKRAYVYQVMHRRDLAIKDYDKILSMYPCDEYALDLRAESYQAMRQAGKAVPDLIKVVRADTDKWNARFRLAFAMMEAGDYKGSIREYSGLLKVYPYSVEGLTGRAEAHLRAKEFKQCVADYTQAIKSDPERSASMHYKRGLAYEKLGDKKKSAEDIALSKKMGYDPKEF